MAVSEYYSKLAILSGQTASPEMTVDSRFTILGIIGPAALTGAVTVQVAEKTGGTFRPLQEPGTAAEVDVNIAAAKAFVINPFPFAVFKLLSTLAEAADRDFFVVMRTRGV